MYHIMYERAGIILNTFAGILLTLEYFITEDKIKQCEKKLKTLIDKLFEFIRMDYYVKYAWASIFLSVLAATGLLINIMTFLDLSISIDSIWIATIRYLFSSNTLLDNILFLFFILALIYVCLGGLLLLLYLIIFCSTRLLDFSPKGHLGSIGIICLIEALLL